MKRPIHTLVIGAAAAVIALGGGAFVAGAANHASFASSAAQDDRGLPGPGGGMAPGERPPLSGTR